MGETIVIIQGAKSADMTKLLSLNATSEWLWNELQDKDFEVEDVTNLILGRYDVDEATAAADSAAWVEKLKESGAVD
jgi:hypothetical protein